MALFSTIEVKDGDASQRDSVVASGYELYNYEKSREGGSVPAAIFNLSKTVIGAGIFTMPSAFNDGGLVFTLIMIILVSYLVCWTMQLLVKTGVSQNILDYRVLIEEAMGKWGSVLYFLSAFIFAYGICVAYAIVTADTVPAVVHAISRMEYSAMATSASEALKVIMDRRIVITLVGVVILLPISSLRFLKHMAVTSFIGLFMFAWTAISAMVLCWTNLPEEYLGEGSIWTIIKPRGIPSVLSRVAFAAVTHHGQFVVYDSIRNTSLKKYNYVSSVSIALSAVSACIFGLVCFVRLREKATGGNVLNYLPNSDIWVQIAKFSFAIDVILTYPLELFISRDLIVKLIHGQEKVLSGWMRFLYSFILVAGTIILSVVFCNLNDVVDFTGGVAASIIAFVLPIVAAFIYNRREGGPIGYVKYIPHLLTLLFGVAMVVITFAVIVPGFSVNNSDCLYKFI